MARHAKKSARYAKATARPAPARKRREFRARKGRTYYAINGEGTEMFRFGSHPQRLAAIKERGLVPLGALEFRNRVAEDVDGKITVHEYLGNKRQSAQVHPVQHAPVAQAAQPVHAPSAPMVAQPMTNIEAIAQAVATALAPMLQQVRPEPATEGAPIGGEQPRATRTVANH